MIMVTLLDNLIPLKGPFHKIFDPPPPFTTDTGIEAFSNKALKSPRHSIMKL
jgi:reverse gyrase